MGRIHFFELEDQAWFPVFLRNYLTDVLQFISNKSKMYKVVIPIIEKGIKKSETKQIIDLGSGGGGGLLWLNEELKKDIPDLKILLTDFFPNIPAFKRTKKQAANFDFLESPIDARAVPYNLKGLRTQFLSLHHFRPEDAKKILQNAVDSENPIAIFEGSERSFTSIFAMIFSPITVLLITPFIRPFSFLRLFFTYIIPIVPLGVMFDGIVSSFRTYSEKEMNELVTSLKNSDSYEWEIGREKSGPSAILYLLGYKNKPSMK